MGWCNSRRNAARVQRRPASVQSRNSTTPSQMRDCLSQFMVRFLPVSRLSPLQLCEPCRREDHPCVAMGCQGKRRGSEREAVAAGESVGVLRGATNSHRQSSRSLAIDHGTLAISISSLTGPKSDLPRRRIAAAVSKRRLSDRRQQCRPRPDLKRSREDSHASGTSGGSGG